MSFLLVPKSVTLNDLERRNGPYFALFHRIRARCRRKTIIRPILRFQNLLLIVYNHINTICTIIQRVFWQNKRRQQPPLQTVVANAHVLFSPNEFLVPANYTSTPCLPFLRKRSPDGATLTEVAPQQTSNCSLLLIYRPERMKGCVGLVG